MQLVSLPRVRHDSSCSLGLSERLGIVALCLVQQIAAINEINCMTRKAYLYAGDDVWQIGDGELIEKAVTARLFQLHLLQEEIFSRHD